MKQSRRVLSLVMAICLIVSIIPAVVSAADTAAGVGTSAVSKGQYIVFGGETWYVANAGKTTTGAAGMTLIHKDVVDSIQYDDGGLKNDWTGSVAESWIDTYVSGLAAADKALILPTSKAAADYTAFGINWSDEALTDELVFFLSAQEVYDLFGENGDAGLIAVDGEGKAAGWWLRSAYADRAIHAGVVSDVGFVGYNHVASVWGARPAMNLDSSKIVFTSAAVGGKVSGAVGANALTAVGENDSDTWKLTVLDEAHKNFTASFEGNESNDLGYESWTINVHFENAVAGENEYVSAAITDNVGKVIYYGHIAVNAVSGTATVNIPTGLTGSKYKLHIFAEQCNGDNATDYGSAMSTLVLKLNDSVSNVEKWELNLNDDISASFKVTVSDEVKTDENATVVYGINGKTTTVPVSEVLQNDGSLGININCAAAEMNDPMTIQINTSAGDGAVHQYSVRSYADYIYANYDYENAEQKKIVDLVSAMLNYGGASQIYFGYELTNIAAADRALPTDYEPANESLKATVEGSSSKISFYGASLIAQTKTTVRFYFTASSLENVTFTATINGRPCDDDDGLTPKKAGTLYYVDVTNIAPNELKSEIVVKADGISVSYSAYHYITRMYHNSDVIRSPKELKDMLRAMYNYYYYANVYAPVS